MLSSEPKRIFSNVKEKFKDPPIREKTASSTGSREKTPGLVPTESGNDGYTIVEQVEQVSSPVRHMSGPATSSDIEAAGQLLFEMACMVDASP